jgi:hypothetical protein
MLWARIGSFQRQSQEVLIFLGYPGLLLAIVGLVEMQRRKLFLRIAAFVAPLLAVALLIGSKLWESRQLLTLTPFIATLVAFGLERIARKADTNERLLKASVMALVATVWLAPQPATFDEGPRSLFGRLYSPWQWSDWQAHETADVATIDRLIAASPARTLAIVTDDVNTDRYLNQQLAQAGFVAPTPRAPVRDCSEIADIFSREERRIIHIRIHQPFVAESELLEHARFVTLALPCLRALAPDETVWLEYGSPFHQNDPANEADARPPTALLPRFEAFLRGPGRDAIAVTPLDQAGLQQLDAWYAREEAEQKEKFLGLGRSYRSVQEAIATTRKLVDFPK